MLDAAVLFGPNSAWWERGLALASLGASIATGGLGPNFGALRASEKLYHYTFSGAVDDILLQGLRPGPSGHVFATPSGGLSAIQAQLDLALPPAGLRDAVLEIDVSTLTKLGINVSAPTLVGRSYNLPGGGYEVALSARIPPQAIRRFR